MLDSIVGENVQELLEYIFHRWKYVYIVDVVMSTHHAN